MSLAPHDLRRRLVAWAVETEGSTRSVALIRIGLAALLWARWASDLQLFRDLTPAGVGLALVFFPATTLMLLGVWSQWTTAIAATTALTFVYAGDALSNVYWGHHNTFLLAYATFLCALTPCGRSYSFDRWWAVRRARREHRPPPAERGNLWGLRLLACQLSAIYFWSAYDKTSIAFLTGERLELIFRWLYVGSSPPAFPGFAAAMPLLAVTTVALEYALAGGMLFAATRRWLAVPGLMLHGLFYVLLPMGTFSTTMWCLYLAYFDADTVHERLDELHGVVDA